MPKHTSADSLQSFIAHARGKGMDHQTIRMLLLSAGWKERDVARAIGEEGLDMPVPMPTDAGGARDAFFHLLAFAGLYTSVISFIILAFAYVHRWLPDEALERFVTEESFRSSVRWPLAALIVAYPIFLWISRLLLRELREHVEKQSGGVRRWLTYLTLFVAASVLMGDLTTLVFSLLSGEVTLRFLLKVIIVFLVAGGTFTYYFQALRRPVSEQGTMHRTYGILTSTLVLLAIANGLFLTGSPVTERQRRMDTQRIQDIRTIAEATFDYVHQDARWTRPLPATIARSLPETLEQIAQASVRQRVQVTDPAGVPYLYRKDDRAHFRVCTTFAFENHEQYAPFWDHPAGEHCYVFDITKPDLP
jgi:hypothetical protein